MTLSAEPLLKVTAFVTRSGREGAAEVALIDTAHGGIQFPAGTMEEGETPEAAARREAEEETGLSAFGQARAAGVLDLDMTPPIAATLRTTPTYLHPRADSASMASLRNGLAVTVARQRNGFAQVTFSEYADVERRALSAQITGWAPAGAITRKLRRYFFMLPFMGQAPPSWRHRADHHEWRVFWAPAAALPPIVAGQAGWAAYLRRALASW